MAPAGIVRSQERTSEKKQNENKSSKKGDSQMQDESSDSNKESKNSNNQGHGGSDPFASILDSFNEITKPKIKEERDQVFSILESLS